MTQTIQKTLRDSAGMRWTALLLLALILPHLRRHHPRQDGRSLHRRSLWCGHAHRSYHQVVRCKRVIHG